jgi:hypothetical protein
MGKRKKVEITYREIDGVLTAGKECTKCGEWKPLETGFHNQKSCIGGKAPQCKSCRNLQTRDWYERTRNQRLVYRKKYFQENRYRCLESMRNWYKENRTHHLERNRKWREENRESDRLIKQRRSAREYLLPDNWTSEQRREVWLYFNNTCALTGEINDIHADHVIPLAVGHGGTIHGNMIPLRSDLNVSKQDSNIFEWFSENRERFNLSEERFNRLIEYLATLNGLTVDEYRQFVYWCHENPREPHEIEDDPRHSIEIWREATGRHFPLPAYAIENENMSDNERSAS